MTLPKLVTPMGFLKKFLGLSTSAADFIKRGNQRFQFIQYDQALADFAEAIRLDPLSALAYLGRAKCLLVKEHQDLAMADLNEAIRLDPTLADAFYERACASSAKNPNRALADLTEAIRLNPDHLNAHVMRAQMYELNEQPQKALADLIELVRLEPNRPQRYRNLAKVHRASGDEASAASNERKAQELDQAGSE
jgi:tetratricopeptide (TPR) repeat protein